MLLIPPSVQLRLKVMRLQVSERTQPPCPSSPWGCADFWPPSAVRVSGWSQPLSQQQQQQQHSGVPQRVPRSPLTVSGEVPRRQTGSQGIARNHCLDCGVCQLFCAVLWGSAGLQGSSCSCAMFLREKKEKIYERQGKLTTNRGRQIIHLWIIMHTSKNTFRGLISPWNFWECLGILIYECIIVLKASEQFSLWKGEIRLNLVVAGTVSSHSCCK